MAGVVETTNTFATNDVITSTAMNNIIDQTLFTSDAIVSANTTLALVSGKMKVGTITSNEMGVGAVTANALATDAVTTVKILDSNVTTAKIADSNVTTAKIADASVTAPKLNGAQTGTAPIFGARAYGAFNGTATSPITPIKAGNITSITRTSTGNYTIVMTTAMPDANYCVIPNAYHNVGIAGANSVSVVITNSTTFTLAVLNNTGTNYNPIYLGFSVFA
jgi:hypothetical protein